MADIYRLGEDDLDDKKIIHPKMRDKRVLNVFRDLRTKLLQRAENKNFTLLVTSIAEGGGSSFVTTNLAASFALEHESEAMHAAGESGEVTVSGVDARMKNFCVFRNARSTIVSSSNRYSPIMPF